MLFAVPPYSNAGAPDGPRFPKGHPSPASGVACRDSFGAATRDSCMRQIVGSSGHRRRPATGDSTLDLAPQILPHEVPAELSSSTRRHTRFFLGGPFD